jgi:hypothetical protein
MNLEAHGLSLPAVPFEETDCATFPARWQYRGVEADALGKVAKGLVKLRTFPECTLDQIGLLEVAVEEGDVGLLDIVTRSGSWVSGNVASTAWEPMTRMCPTPAISAAARSTCASWSVVTFQSPHSRPTPGARVRVPDLRERRRKVSSDAARALWRTSR